MPTYLHLLSQRSVNHVHLWVRCCQLKLIGFVASLQWNIRISRWLWGSMTKRMVEHTFLQISATYSYMAVREWGLCPIHCFYHDVPHHYDWNKWQQMLETTSKFHLSKGQQGKGLMTSDHIMCPWTTVGIWFYIKGDSLGTRTCIIGCQETASDCTRSPSKIRASDSSAWVLGRPTWAQKIHEHERHGIPKDNLKKEPQNIGCV